MSQVARARPDIEWILGDLFLSADALAAFLAEAGFTIEAQFGDWDRSPVVAATPELITIARVPGIPD